MIFKRYSGNPTISTMVIALACLMVDGCGNRDKEVESRQIPEEVFPVPSIEYGPQRYLCRWTPDPIIIDGRMDDSAWNEPAVGWTSYFIDIEGGSGPDPVFRTRVKMLWDEEYFYIAAYLAQPHVRACLTMRDAVIYNDNDFEIFIDPDGDTHEYYELEINAFGTVWDLFLVKPYRDGGPAVNAWNIGGLRTAVHIDGTINKTDDIDRGWTVEVAIPWEILGECAHRKVPPDNGDIWFVNFSRVEWDVKIENGKYVKQTDPETGRPNPEHNWVWSPQGIMNMHYPEMWGLVMFTNVIKPFDSDSFTPAPVEQARWLMRKIYYGERTHFIQFGFYTTDLGRLGIEDPGLSGYVWPPAVHVTPGMFEAVFESDDGNSGVRITHDGRLTVIGEE